MNIISNNVNSVNNFKSHYRRDSFREKELFNSNDKVKKGYSTYDGYDLTNSDFLNEEYETSNKTTEEKLLDNYFNDYNLNIQYRPMISIDSTMIDSNQDAVDLAMIKTKSGEKFSGNLYNHVQDKLKKFPIDDVEKLTNNSKLKRKDNSEYVDYNLFEAGFKIKNKAKNIETDIICDMLNNTVSKDDKGNEVCDLTKLETLKSYQTASLYSDARRIKENKDYNF